MNETELRRLFSPHGTIVHCKVVTDRATQRSMGYGFVKFETVDAANAAIAAKNGLQIGTKRIKVSIARPTGNEIRNCKLFAANLPLHFRRGPLRPGGARASAE